MSQQVKKIYLSDTDKKLLGVCGGLGKYFEIDSTLIRLGWVALTILTGIFPGVFGYIIAAVIMPNESKS